MSRSALPSCGLASRPVDMAEIVVGPVRAESLEYRFKCEKLLIARAIEQPEFGWGGWGRSAVFFYANTRFARPVQLTGCGSIILGTKGFGGLILCYLALILPAALFVWRFPVRLWGDPRVAAGSLAAVLLSLYIVDCLMNAFPNMIYVTLAGGLISLEPKQLRTTVARRAGKAVDQAGQGKPRLTALGTTAIGPGPHGGQIILAERYSGLGRSFQARGAPERGGVRLAAGPRLADRPGGSRARLARAAAVMVRLRQRLGLALGQSP